ncbi:hypothetical protein D3C78_1377990 [compost metagenome]
MAADSSAITSSTLLLVGDIQIKRILVVGEQQDPPSLVWSKDRHYKEIKVTDYARKPSRQQAVKLNFIEVILRRLCYVLAQKGNPDV